VAWITVCALKYCTPFVQHQADTDALMELLKHPPKKQQDQAQRDQKFNL
jgi:hypothetical protein